MCRRLTSERAARLQAPFNVVAPTRGAERLTVERGLIWCGGEASRGDGKQELQRGPRISAGGLLVDMTGGVHHHPMLVETCSKNASLK